MRPCAPLQIACLRVRAFDCIARAANLHAHPHCLKDGRIVRMSGAIRFLRSNSLVYEAKNVAVAACE